MKAFSFVTLFCAAAGLISCGTPTQQNTSKVSAIKPKKSFGKNVILSLFVTKLFKAKFYETSNSAITLSFELVNAGYDKYKELSWGILRPVLEEGDAKRFGLTGLKSERIPVEFFIENRTEDTVDIVVRQLRTNENEAELFHYEAKGVSLVSGSQRGIETVRYGKLQGKMIVTDLYPSYPIVTMSERIAPKAITDHWVPRQGSLLADVYQRVKKFLLALDLWGGQKPQDQSHTLSQIFRSARSLEEFESFAEDLEKIQKVSEWEFNPRESSDGYDDYLTWPNLNKFKNEFKPIVDLKMHVFINRPRLR